MVIRVFYCTRGLGAGFFLQFCELLGGLVMSTRGLTQIQLQVGESTFLQFRIPAMFWLHVGIYWPNMVQSFCHPNMEALPLFSKKENPL